MRIKISRQKEKISFLKAYKNFKNVINAILRRTDYRENGLYCKKIAFKLAFALIRGHTLILQGSSKSEINEDFWKNQRSIFETIDAHLYFNSTKGFRDDRIDSKKLGPISINMEAVYKDISDYIPAKDYDLIFSIFTINIYKSKKKLKWEK